MLHLSADPFVTMHHLIGADLLLKTTSGFSDIAAIYSAGTKLALGWYETSPNPNPSLSPSPSPSPSPSHARTPRISRQVTSMQLSSYELCSGSIGLTSRLTRIIVQVWP